MTAIGVLALQGDFTAHADVLRRLDCDVREVRRVAQLDGLAGLVIPGGESTTLLKLMEDEPWFDALRAFHQAGGAIFGTCAGAILLAHEVRRRPGLATTRERSAGAGRNDSEPATSQARNGSQQASLGLLDVVVERNAWGRQVDSFEVDLSVPSLGTRRLRAVFIRAPRFREVGPDVEVLASLEGEPVLVRQGSVLAATFHPEIAGEAALHAAWLASIAAGVTATAAPALAESERLYSGHPTSP